MSQPAASQLTPLMVDNIIADVRNCYNMCEGSGWVEQEPQTGRLAHFIGFRQPVPFLYGYQLASNAYKAQQNQQQAAPATDCVEVFISGRGFPHSIAQIASRTNRQLVLGQQPLN